MQAFKTTKKKRLLIESEFDEWQSLLMLHKVSPCRTFWLCAVIYLHFYFIFLLSNCMSNIPFIGVI